MKASSVARLLVGLTATSAFWMAGPLSAQEGSGNSKPAEWTVDDILLTESAGDYQISPDGRWLVWVKSQMDKEKGRRVSNLFLSSLTADKEIQLTRGKDSHGAPRWSPDGKLISFISTREPADKKEGAASSQIWLIDPAGGEPWPLTSLERAVRSHEWRDSTTIVFSAQEDASLYEQEVKKQKDTSRVVEDAEHEPPIRLFSVAVKDGEIQRLTYNDDWISSFALSPDGKQAVAVHSRSLSYGYDQRNPPVTYLWDLEEGEGRQIFDGSRIIPSDVQWATDGRGFYLVNDSTTHPLYREATISLIVYYDLASESATLVDLGWERGHGFDYGVTDDGFVALLADGVRFKPARFTKSGDTWRRTWIEGSHTGNIFDFESSDDGATIVYTYSTANTPPQLYRAGLRGARIRDEVQLTKVNPDLEKKPKPRVEVVRWIGARDEEVEGLLYYPLDYEEGTRYPLVLSIHGGPASADRDAWSMGWSRPIVLLNQKGAFVLKANYHGSSSYGLDWVESICCGNYYRLEIPDLENGVDYLIERGLADPDRLGTMGWSNGAILSIQLTTLNPRYKAASTGAGDVEWISDWANVDFGAAFDGYYFGAAPYEDPQRYVELSPFFRMKDVKTPTIIYFGTEDRNVPTDQGWSHYRALQQIGEVPVRFLLFPGEPHGLGKLVHQRRKVEEELAWFDRYLFGTHEPENEALKKDSPLAQALKRENIAEVAGRYGRIVEGALVPEVVKYEGFEIGRFEVTRAQFAAHDGNYDYEAGSENYPANDITFEQALDYVAWLSDLTGEPYRLGREEELKPLYSAAKGNENTLDYWAGYEPNPDDVELLAAKIGGLSGRAPLLREVGSFAGRGAEELVFDLGGNVAEWAIGADGEAALLGGSADRPSDTGARGAEAAYRGFRVVRDSR
ncbi:MAG: prolyl oligopeptidase family serine peptidase [Gemmatimonadota bacterium]|nr:MAG: prolyl oligopeptidase family serine peptidase [Gemmatimonadota bacterium]